MSAVKMFGLQANDGIILELHVTLEGGRGDEPLLLTPACVGEDIRKAQIRLLIQDLKRVEAEGLKRIKRWRPRPLTE